MVVEEDQLQLYRMIALQLRSDKLLYLLLVEEITLNIKFVKKVCRLNFIQTKHSILIRIYWIMLLAAAHRRLHQANVAMRRRNQRPLCMVVQSY